MLSMFRNWRQPFRRRINYFEHRLTNGFVEGKNNRIKLIKRMAYPSEKDRNMDNLRRRILLSNNLVAVNPVAAAGHHAY